MDKYRELVILIAEDDDGHADLIKEGLTGAGICNSIMRFENGEEIWNFINSQETRSALNVKTTYLILLDINMPKMDGIEVLKRIKSDEVLKDIPVMMLTTTDDPREVESCYSLGCNMYVTKPVDFVKFAETLKRLGLFIQVVKI